MDEQRRAGQGQAMNRRMFFRRGLRELLRPVVEMAEQINHPVARLPQAIRPAPAEGRVARGTMDHIPADGVSIDPYPREANAPAGQSPRDQPQQDKPCGLDRPAGD